MTDDEIDEFFNHDPETKEPAMTTTFTTHPNDTNTLTPGQGVVVPSSVEDIQVTDRKVTIHFSRTVQVTQYQPAHASMTSEFSLPADYSVGQYDRLISDEFAAVKSAVLEQLGLGFTYDEDRRLIEEVFPDSTLVASPGVPVNPGAGTGFNPPPTSFPAPAPAPAQSYGAKKGPKPEDKPKWDVVVAELQRGPAQSFFDNRGNKKNPNSPEFKFKNDSQFAGDALWLNSCPVEYKAYFGVQ